MGSVNVGHLYRKRTVRGLDGSIKLMEDEADGGVIIRNGQVVNQAKVDELAAKERDRQASATAFVNPQPAPANVSVEERTIAPSKVDKLEKEVADMKDNIATILSLLQKK